MPLNLGLLHPLDVVRAAEDAHRAGAVPIASTEGFVRQVLGWREYVWQLYWRFGRGYLRRNALRAHTPLPDWWRALDADAVTARCLRVALEGVRDRGWTHHIQRLMVLGNHALQRGYRPAELSDWFREAFVDGFEWVMPPNVIGMSQHADGGMMATKPYSAGGAYVARMSDHCGECAFDPRKRLGPRRLPVHRGLLGVDAPPPRVAGGQPPHGAGGREHGTAGRPGRRRSSRSRLGRSSDGALRGARYSERVSRAHVLDLVGTLARLGLAAVWLVSGTLKAIDLDQTVVAVRAYDVLPRAAVDVVAAVLPFLEIALGLLLLLGVGTRLVAVVAAVLLLAFVAGVTQAWARGLSIDCGCFGGGGAVDPGDDGLPAGDRARRRVPRVGRVAHRPTAHPAFDGCTADRGKDLTWVERHEASASGARMRPRNGSPRRGSRCRRSAPTRRS